MKRKLLWVLVIGLPLMLAGWMVAWQAGENAVLNRAAEHLRAGRLEAAITTLQPIRTRPLLSAAGRRRAAALLLRLGEDQQAHTLLVGQRFDEQDPEDRRLRELSAQAQRAASLLHKADQSQDPNTRLRHIREARAELPEAPQLLQREVLETLSAQIAAKNGARAGELEQQFLEAYTELRKTAPTLADEAQRQIKEALSRSDRGTPLISQ